VREVIAVCRSGKKSRERTARVLDRYFWRIGDRTWRGKATNACLDRMSRELRRGATRNTAVTIYEIRSAHESRAPLTRIGSRAAFSDEGLVPIASHPAAFYMGMKGSEVDACAAAVVRVAALFHDLGKATKLFQDKLRRGLKGGQHEADAVRHELHSAAVWDRLFGKCPDEGLGVTLAKLVPEQIDNACLEVAKKLAKLHFSSKNSCFGDETGFSFLEPRQEGSLTHLIGMLILTHHRLPEGDSGHLAILVGRHVSKGSLDQKKLRIAKGTPFWHGEWWLTRLKREAKKLDANKKPTGADIALRASLMLADHVGSARKQGLETCPDHLANTTNSIRGRRKRIPGDDLATHVRRVYAHARGAFDLLHRYRDRFPALDEGQVPVGVMHPEPSSIQHFRWQAEAARVARTVCAHAEGGFFACILAGTGAGKTRGAPTILANAAMGDVRPERRYLRMFLGLGLRVLAYQSAREYVDGLGFSDEDVACLIGQPPVQFNWHDPGDEQGAESMIDLPEWLLVERGTGGVPEEGDAREVDWIRSLSADTSRGLPAFCDLVLEHAGKRAETGRRLLAPPIILGTIDHFMGVASPVNARFLVQALRLFTSDLILDEIDQFDGEDIAAIGRLVFQAGTAGRRVIIMSATLTGDIAEALHIAYTRGWSEFARARKTSAHVNLLCSGDVPHSCFTNQNGQDLGQVMAKCREAVLSGIRASPPARRGKILPPCNSWVDLVKQIDRGCARMHSLNAEECDGFRVSVGMVRLTRISHTAGLAVQLPSGEQNGRLRAKVCLHSQFPRLHRAWIEARLMQALTRKGHDPEKGVKLLCQDERLFERAEKIGTKDIEIVVISSPVIETGNDMDFDYAVLDPSSVRSIIQAAGRVRRHRSAEGEYPNVLILGRSPIAMQDGSLRMPGVETKPHDETKIPGRHLDEFEGRLFDALSGDEDFARISAAPVISGVGFFPLRDREAELRSDMVSTSDDAPLGKYTKHINTRFNLTMTRTRRFRRSDSRDILYQLDGDSLDDAAWYVDLLPGTSESAFHEAKRLGLKCDGIDDECLFRDPVGCAWSSRPKGAEEMLRQDLNTLMRVTIPDYGEDIEPAMSYSEFTGFTRGKPEDLYEPFGKR